MRKRRQLTTNYFVVLTVDEENRIIAKPFEPLMWRFDVTDVTGDANAAVHLLRMGAPVKMVKDDDLLAGIYALYAKVVELGQQFSLQAG